MIRILGDRVLVLLPPAPEDIITESGIILKRDPDLAKIPTRGIVAQLGEKRGTVELDDVLRCLDEWVIDTYGPEARHNVLEIAREVDALLKHTMQPAPFEVQIGDCVIFSPGDGEQLDLDGATYVILREAEILGIVEKSEAA